MTTQQFFATCPKGLEGLLAQELTSLLATSTPADVRETVAGVYFTSDLQGAYAVCLWSRLANKVYLPLGSFPIDNADELYEAARSLEWREHMRPQGSLLVDFIGTNGSIRNTQFGAVRVKDAIVDYFREQAGQRPEVSKNNPDLRIQARLSKGKVTISLDLCGDSLHRRGYRTRQGAAPLKENLAAALLLRAGWPQLAAQGAPLIDPMCGSATILIEAAMMVLDMAPGLNRPEFAFERWPQFDASGWAQLRKQALERYGIARQAYEASDAFGEIRGYDQDGRVLQAAESNVSMAGLEDVIRLANKPLQRFSKPTHKDLKQGLILTNPPYGERLGEQEQLQSLYRLLGDKCREYFAGWQLGVFTSNPNLGKSLGLRASKRYKLFNGALPSELLLIPIQEQQFVNAPPVDLQHAEAQQRQQKITEGAQMLINRLRKNQKQLSKWIKRENISCYRLYDADMPEYAAAIDVYGDYVHVQEYAAPKSIDEDKAIARFEEIRTAVPEALGVAEDNISFKQRRRNRGKQQYERQSERAYPLIPMREGSATVLVNLWEYLDTGLFLDHRPVRKMIGEMARGKRFLNLFCYTATATLHAAVGGAKESVSVDMSKTYLKWAEKNYLANNLSLDKHQLVQANCLEWLQECRQGFDVIMLDPPSFSNSKRMEGVLDIQRDHVGMIKRCMDLLLPGGTLIFSNNLRSFKLDDEALSGFNVKNITKQSLDPDFARNDKIHQCWLISAQ